MVTTYLACVNPGHIEAVTNQENVRRGAAAVTHCRNGHEFTPENTYLTPRDGYRQCRACSRAYELTRNRRKT